MQTIETLSKAVFKSVAAEVSERTSRRYVRFGAQPEGPNEVEQSSLLCLACIFTAMRAVGGWRAKLAHLG